MKEKKKRGKMGNKERLIHEEGKVGGVMSEGVLGSEKGKLEVDKIEETLYTCMKLLKCL